MARSASGRAGEWDGSRLWDRAGNGGCVAFIIAIAAARQSR